MRCRSQPRELPSSSSSRDRRQVARLHRGYSFLPSIRSRVFRCGPLHFNFRECQSPRRPAPHSALKRTRWKSGALAERQKFSVHTGGVTGSIPVVPTIHLVISRMAADGGFRGGLGSGIGLASRAFWNARNGLGYQSVTSSARTGELGSGCSWGAVECAPIQRNRPRGAWLCQNSSGTFCSL